MTRDNGSGNDQSVVLREPTVGYGHVGSQRDGLLVGLSLSIISYLNSGAIKAVYDSSGSKAIFKCGGKTRNGCFGIEKGISSEVIAVEKVFMVGNTYGRLGSRKSTTSELSGLLCTAPR